MNTEPLAFQRAERAILQLIHAGEHLPLDEMAADAGLSPSHFQREFKRMTGVSPKQMSQLLARERLIAALRDCGNVLDATFAAGLSSTSRAHELILTTDGATPAEMAAGGARLQMRYGVVPSELGDVFAAWTGRGLASLSFSSDVDAALAELRRVWPQAQLLRDDEAVAPHVRAALGAGGKPPAHVRGTHFQLKVWQALMQLPSAALVSYGHIARALRMPKAARAVGNAVGANPVAVVIPCHRVIRETGSFTGYRWGPARKSVLLARELAAAH
jgi:AraC family transcriptional regulator of adaptative response/methylated-DNA-[protein]-cysteine methyltransferase